MITLFLNGTAFIDDQIDKLAQAFLAENKGLRIESKRK